MEQLRRALAFLTECAERMEEAPLGSDEFVKLCVGASYCLDCLKMVDEGCEREGHTVLYVSYPDYDEVATAIKVLKWVLDGCE